MAAENQNLEEILFDLAVKKPTAEERAAFLDGVCEGNPGLRASLDELLEGHFAAEGFLPKAAAARPSPLVGPNPLLDVSAPAPRIGRYKLLEKLGEGGFGEVWMAEQREPIKRRVALKIIKLGMDSRQVIARFEAERQALAMMDHPNIAKVLDAGTTGTEDTEAPIADLKAPIKPGRPYFVMELVRGIKITDYCDQNNLPTRERLVLFIKVCQAIQHAHQKGIIHRDIKPSNILVTLHDGVPVPKVIDFGIAKATQQELTDKTVFTHFQQFIGTPAYISPEQAEMSGLDVDTRSDIYSLGVLLYELLVGRTPLDAAELTKGGIDALRKAIRDEEPLRPSTRLRALHEADRTATARCRRMDPQTLTHQLRGDLDWIALKALEKDRTRRYETANGFARDIERYLNSQPVTAVPPSTAYLFRKYVRRHKTAFVLSGIVVVLLVAGTVVSSVLAIQARRAQRAAEQARISESEQKRIAQQMESEARTAQAIAEREQRRAELGERELGDLLYATKIRFAQSAFEQLNFPRVRELLDETHAHPKRGLEWFYWHRQMHPETRRLIGHVGPVYRVAFSPDGRRLATTGEDGMVILWDTATGEELLRRGIDDPERPARMPTWYGSVLSFSSDGRWLLSNMSQAGDLRVLDAATGEQRLRLPGEGFGDFSPDRREFVTAKGRHVRFWDLRSGRLTRSFQGITPLMPRYLRDGQSLFLRDLADYVIVDAATGNRIRTVSTQSIHVQWGVETISPDGALMAVAGRFGSPTTLWDATAEGRSVAALPEGLTDELAVAFSRDGKQLAIARDDRTVRVWDAVGQKELRRLDGHTAPVLSVDFSRDGRWIASASQDGTVRIWDLETEPNPLVKEFSESAEGMVSAVSPDGRRVVTSSTAGLTIWDAATPQTLRTITVVPHPDTPARARIESVGFSPDGKSILSSGWNGEVNVFDMQTGDRRLTLSLGDANVIVTTSSFSPDGARILTGSLRHGFSVWDAANGTRLLTLSERSSGWALATFSPDGRRIMTSDEDATIVWDTSTGQRLRQLPGFVSDHHPTVLGVSEDGSRVALTDAGNTVTVWNVATGQSTLRLTGHKEWISSVQFSPDGSRILTGSGDGTARLWDAETGRELLVLVGHAQPVVSARFFPEGHRILTSSWDHTARVWSFATPDQAAACQREEEAGAQRVAARAPEVDARKLARARAEKDRVALAEREAGELAAWVERVGPPPRHRTVPASEKAAPPAAGFLSQWLVLSPIPYEGTAALAVFLDPLPDPARLRPREGERVRLETHDLAWSALRLGDDKGWIDFQALASREGPSDTDGKLAYAVTYIRSKLRHTGLVLRIQCLDTGRLYLNGREVYRQTEARRDTAFRPDEVSGIELREGVNTVVFKVVNATESWTGMVMLLDATGQAVDGVRVTLDPDAGN